MMDIKKWLRGASPEEREEVCRLAGTKVPYLFQVSCGHRTASPGLARKLANASAVITPERRLTLHGIRPDIWDGDTAVSV